MRSPRLWAALALFSLIGLLAMVTLEGKLRQAVLIVTVGLAVRVVIAHFAAPVTPPRPDNPTASETPESL